MNCNCAKLWFIVKAVMTSYNYVCFLCVVEFNSKLSRITIRCTLPRGACMCHALCTSLHESTDYYEGLRNSSWKLIVYRSLWRSTYWSTAGNLKSSWVVHDCSIVVHLLESPMLTWQVSQYVYHCVDFRVQNSLQCCEHSFLALCVDSAFALELLFCKGWLVQCCSTAEIPSFRLRGALVAPHVLLVAGSWEARVVWFWKEPVVEHSSRSTALFIICKLQLELPRNYYRRIQIDRTNSSSDQRLTSHVQCGGDVKQPKSLSTV